MSTSSKQIVHTSICRFPDVRCRRILLNIKKSPKEYKFMRREILKYIELKRKPSQLREEDFTLLVLVNLFLACIRLSSGLIVCKISQNSICMTS